MRLYDGADWCDPYFNFLSFYRFIIVWPVNQEGAAAERQMTYSVIVAR